MHSSQSALMTILDRVRTYTDDPDIDAKFTNDFLVRNMIGPAWVDVWSRINNTLDAPVILTFDIDIETDQLHYPLPPCVQEVLRLVVIDDNGKVLQDIRPRDRMSPVGEKWSIEGTGGALSLYIPSDSSSLRFVDRCQVWYTSNGSADIHYCSGVTGGSVTQIAFTGASWSESTMTLTKTGAFASYEWEVGDKITITAGTSTTKGTYVISSRTSDDALVLATSPGASASSISARVWSRIFKLPTAAATVGGKDRRTNAYVGQILRVLPSSDLSEIHERTISAYYCDGTNWIVETRLPFDPGSATSNIPYEVVMSGTEALMEAIAVRAAMKLAVVRKSSQANQSSLRIEYLSALKSIIDNLGQMNLRKPKMFITDTIDFPAAGTYGPPGDAR
jgi:hypothetical protein